MSSSGCTYRFIESTISTSTEKMVYDIEIRQQPQRAKVSLVNERDRRSIEPPPILQLQWKNCTEEELKKCLQSPFYFIVANLVTEDDPETPLMPVQNYLSGTTVSSLYRLRDVDNSDGGFFVFGDLAVKKEGKFKLRFSLFEIVEGQVNNRKTILSNTFTVYIPKQYPGPVEATFLSRTFSDQGVKMRIRKEHRLQSRKRKSDPATKDCSVDNERATKKYHSKHINMIVSSSSNIEPVNNNSTSDVFFGKWQVASRTTPSSAEAVGHRPSLLPSNSFNASPSTVTNVSSQTQPRSKDHIQAFPSPESTVYNSISSTPQYSSVWHRRETVHRSVPIRDTAVGTVSPSPLSPKHTSIPPLSFKNSIASPPFKSISSSPSNTSLAQYHTCFDNHSQHTSAVKRLPTPPSCFNDIPREQHWGTTLPPLRAIMNSADDFRSESSSLFPLLLPPPSTMIAANKTFLHR